MNILFLQQNRLNEDIEQVLWMTNAFGYFGQNQSNE